MPKAHEVSNGKKPRSQIFFIERFGFSQIYLCLVWQLHCRRALCMPCICLDIDADEMSSHRLNPASLPLAGAFEFAMLLFFAAALLNRGSGISALRVPIGNGGAGVQMLDLHRGEGLPTGSAGRQFMAWNQAMSHGS
jgi:hypothetical protein